MEILNIFNSITSVSSGISTLLQSYTVPSGKTDLMQQIEVSGTNIAEYKVIINSDIVAKKRTYFGASLNTCFNFAVGNTYGRKLESGDVLEIYGNNLRTDNCDFDARIYGVTVNTPAVNIPYVLDQYNEVISLSGNSSSDICTYTVPSGKILYLMYVEAGGENIAKFDVK